MNDSHGVDYLPTPLGQDVWCAVPLGFSLQNMKRIVLRARNIPWINYSAVSPIVPSATNALIHRREYHISTPNQNPLIYGGIGILATAVAAQYALQWYNNRPAPSEQATNSNTEDSQSVTEEEPTTETQKTERKQDKKEGAQGASSFLWLDSWFAKRFYEGGFEEKMTKREAALILGIRESAPPEKVKAAHRRILLLNHPDRGGSPYLSLKINEAKDLLLKGKE